MGNDDRLARIREDFAATVGWPGASRGPVPPGSKPGPVRVSATEHDGGFSAASWAEDSMGNRYHVMRADGPYRTREAALEGLAALVREEASHRLRRLIDTADAAIWSEPVTTAEEGQRERIRRLFAAVVDVHPAYLRHVHLSATEHDGKHFVSLFTSREDIGEYHGLELGTPFGTMRDALNEMERLVAVEADRRRKALVGVVGSDPRAEEQKGG